MLTQTSTIWKMRSSPRRADRPPPMAPRRRVHSRASLFCSDRQARMRPTLGAAATETARSHAGLFRGVQHAATRLSLPSWPVADLRRSSTEYVARAVSFFASAAERNDRERTPFRCLLARCVYKPTLRSLRACADPRPDPRPDAPRRSSPTARKIVSHAERLTLPPPPSAPPWWRR